MISCCCARSSSRRSSCLNVMAWRCLLKKTRKRSRSRSWRCRSARNSAISFARSRFLNASASWKYGDDSFENVRPCKRKDGRPASLDVPSGRSEKLEKDMLSSHMDILVKNSCNSSTVRTLSMRKPGMGVSQQSGGSLDSFAIESFTIFRKVGVQYACWQGST